MAKKVLIGIITIISLVIVLCISLVFYKFHIWHRHFPSEKVFYKKSDIGTDVYQLTTDINEDHIYYQQPNYFSPDSSKFLFKSDRAEVDGLYLVDIESGEITVLKKVLAAHCPTWSKDGSEVYFGQFGNITAINTQTFKERKLKIPGLNFITFLYTNKSGDKIIFIEGVLDTNRKLSIINTDGTNYHVLYELDQKTEFYLDHPVFINNDYILFLTRGEGRDAEGKFNRPYIMDLDGNTRRLPVECSHYDVHPNGDKILCGTEGYIIDLQGNILKDIPFQGHGVWHPGGDKFLMTQDPMTAWEENPYLGKITIHDYDTGEYYTLVSHENTYNSTIEVHIQPNAQFSRDGKYVIYESDRGKQENSDLYLVGIK